MTGYPRYMVVSAGNNESMSFTVSKLMKSGWVPQGGICWSDHGEVFFQAMVHYGPITE